MKHAKTIMTAIYNAIKYENVYPVIMCGDAEAKKVITKALRMWTHTSKHKKLQYTNTLNETNTRYRNQWVS